MTGNRMLICKSIMIDVCPKRQALIERQYKGHTEILHEILLGADKRYHCGLLPCLEDKK